MKIYEYLEEPASKLSREPKASQASEPPSEAQKKLSSRGKSRKVQAAAAVSAWERKKPGRLRLGLGLGFRRGGRVLRLEGL